MKMEQTLEIGAAAFKAKCLQLLDEISKHKHDSIIITKRGKPVAKLSPIDDAGGPIYGAMKGLGSTPKVVHASARHVRISVDGEWGHTPDRRS
jgi:prevent-host-death family protein